MNAHHNSIFKTCMVSALVVGSFLSAKAELNYRLTVDPNARSVKVSLNFEAKEGVNTIRIPKWCPGFYSLKNYHEKLSEIRVTKSTGEDVLTQYPQAGVWTFKLDKPEAVQFTYRVLGDDPGLGFFGVTVRQTSAFVNIPAAFVYPDGRLREKCRLNIMVPEGWDIATAVDADGKAFVAGDYDELLDHPIEMGIFQRRKFEVMGKPFEAVYTSTNGRYPDLDASVKELKALSEPAMRMFGGAPFKRYLYIVHLAVGNFGGGLEHRASTVLAVPNSNPLELGSLAAHEFFHVWNVKHIRPKILGPFDYTQPQRTRNLWFSEGVTDYYAQLHTYQAGSYTEDGLLATLGWEIDGLQSGRSRKTISLEDACLKTWESSGFGYGDMSYYTKGLVIGLLMDALIIDATDGEKTLDDMMRTLFYRHKLPNPGFEEDGLRLALNELTERDFTGLYARMLRSTDELPYELLEPIGLQAVPQSGNTEWRVSRIENPSARQKRLYEVWLSRKPSFGPKLEGISAVIMTACQPR